MTNEAAMVLGVCTDCGEPKTAREIEDGRWCCRECRVRRAATIARKRTTDPSKTPERSA